MPGMTPPSLPAARHVAFDWGGVFTVGTFDGRSTQNVAERSGVRLRWLVVEGRAMNVDHNPRDAFEKDAARALASGEDEHEAAADGVYRRAGPVTLGAECLKCHLPGRTSNKGRTAGLLISMPIGKE